MSLPNANRAIDALESVEALDETALTLAGAVGKTVPGGVARDALSGTWLGHPLHPPLTDVVIGSFTGRARERLIEIGLLSAAPTIGGGLSDWAMSVYGDRRTRPVGLAYASVT